jgi:hypothetical protein
MTKLNQIKQANNRYCGPAAISIISGCDTDVAERLIQEQRGNSKNVIGSWTSEVRVALGKLGWRVEEIAVPDESLFSVLMKRPTIGVWLVTVPGHFIVIEVASDNCYICDTATKKPINMSASVRLQSKVLEMNRFVKR